MLALQFALVECCLSRMTLHVKFGQIVTTWAGRSGYHKNAPPPLGTPCKPRLGSELMHNFYESDVSSDSCRLLFMHTHAWHCVQRNKERKACVHSGVVKWAIGYLQLTSCESQKQKFNTGVSSNTCDGGLGALALPPTVQLLSCTTGTMMGPAIAKIVYFLYVLSRKRTQ